MEVPQVSVLFCQMVRHKPIESILMELEAELQMSMATNSKEWELQEAWHQ